MTTDFEAHITSLIAALEGAVQAQLRDSDRVTHLYISRNELGWQAVFCYSPESDPLDLEMVRWETGENAEDSFLLVQLDRAAEVARSIVQKWNFEAQVASIADRLKAADDAYQAARAAAEKLPEAARIEALRAAKAAHKAALASIK